VLGRCIESGRRRSGGLKGAADEYSSREGAGDEFGLQLRAAEEPLSKYSEVSKCPDTSKNVPTLDLGTFADTHA
jgi:hypothetical protein